MHPDADPAFTSPQTLPSNRTSAVRRLPPASGSLLHGGASAGGVGGDLLDELRPELARQIVAHAVDHLQTGAGDGARGGAAAGGVDEDVVLAVDDQGGDV